MSLYVSVCFDYSITLFLNNKLGIVYKKGMGTTTGAGEGRGQLRGGLGENGDVLK